MITVVVPFQMGLGSEPVSERLRSVSLRQVRTLSFLSTPGEDSGENDWGIFFDSSGDGSQKGSEEQIPAAENPGVE